MVKETVTVITSGSRVCLFPSPSVLIPSSSHLCPTDPGLAQAPKLEASFELPRAVHFAPRNPIRDILPN